MAELNKALAGWEADPLFSEELIGKLSNHGLRKAVHLTENWLMWVTERMGEV